MTQVRVLSPASAGSPIAVFGRSYAQVPGTAIDVPTGDTGTLCAAGWFRIALSGPTGARPTQGVALAGVDGLHPGKWYLDTTLGRLIVFDGIVWRDPATGALV